MALQLSPENQARITELLERGEYPDADAVIARARCAFRTPEPG